MKHLKRKFDHELGLESIENKRWNRRKLCWLCKTFNRQSSKYLFEIIHTLNRTYVTRNANNIPLLKVNHIVSSKTFFFIHCICRKSENLAIFKKRLLQLACTSGNSISNCHNPKEIQLLTRLRLGLGHLFLNNINKIKIRVGSSPSSSI